ncbi:MAG: glucosaminidase domain-containing protein [Bacteroidetes bacterium]|nr:glucosaminidase domain-containing protein [Bacteroidota bacterium]
MKLYLLAVFILIQSFAFATITPEQYIELYKDDAIKEMYEYGVPASITLAQGMLESNYGNSILAQQANNHFGIKCHSDWTGATYHMDDDSKNECFRKYNDVLESYRDHSVFLKTRSRYAALFALKITDYQGWAAGLKAAGYATNPKYPQLLTNMIERYGLQQYDTSANVMAGVHEVLLSKNFVKYVNSNGSNLDSIAKEFQISLRQLYKYNDRNDTMAIGLNEPVYLQPKRRKGTTDIYVVALHDSYWSISQKFAIQLKHLYKKNHIVPGSDPVVGETLYLRKRKR